MDQLVSTVLPLGDEPFVSAYVDPMSRAAVQLRVFYAGDTAQPHSRVELVWYPVFPAATRRFVTLTTAPETSLQSAMDYYLLVVRALLAGRGQTFDRVIALLKTTY